MKYLRIARGLTRAQLAEQSGVGYRTIQKIEHNLVRRLHSRTTQKLTQALNVEPSMLVRLISEAPEDPRRIGSRLREARYASGMSQAEVARRANISQGHLSQLECGNYEAGPATIQRLAHVLGVKPTELLGVE
jgi:transcriptional regulator with XRE-family HTH domain